MFIIVHTRTDQQHIVQVGHIVSAGPSRVTGGARIELSVGFLDVTESVIDILKLVSMSFEDTIRLQGRLLADGARSAQ